MTRAITDYKAFGIDISEPVTTRGVQYFELSWTQANSDLACDLANVAGTFWTQAGASGLGVGALAALTEIISKVGARISWSAPAFEDAKVKIAASGSLAATTEYQITTTSIVPSFLFYTAGAPTSATFTLLAMLKSQQLPTRAGNI